MTGIQRIAIALLPTIALAAGPPGTATDEMSEIRSAYVDLRRDLLLEIPSPIAPADSQVAVFVTVDPEARATLEAVSLAVNGQLVSYQRYTALQLRALIRGGANRLYIGDLAPGTNTLLMTFAGQTRKDKPYARSQTVEVVANGQPHFVRFELARTSTKGEPDVLVSEATKGGPRT